MFYFHIFVLIFTVYFEIQAILSRLIFFDQCRAVLHKNSSNQIGTMKSNFDIQQVIEGQVGEIRKDLANHYWAGYVSLEKLQEDFDQIQILKFYQHILILVRQVLETYEYVHNRSLIIGTLKLIDHFQRSSKFTKQEQKVD